jgi:hypothetical protein
LAKRAPESQDSPKAFHFSRLPHTAFIFPFLLPQTSTTHTSTVSFFPCTRSRSLSTDQLQQIFFSFGLFHSNRTAAALTNQDPAAPPIAISVFHLCLSTLTADHHSFYPQPADPAPPPNSPTAAPFFLRPNTAAASAVLFPVFSQSHRDNNNNNPATPTDRQPSRTPPSSPQALVLTKTRTGHCSCTDTTEVQPPAAPVTFRWPPETNEKVKQKEKKQI